MIMFVARNLDWLSRLGAFMVEPYLFTLEGLDGAGKTTHIVRLHDELTDKGHTSVVLSSPSKSVLGKFIRANMNDLNPVLKDQLFTIDMEDSLRNVYSNTEVILFDRYVDSIYASNTETTRASLALISGNLPTPDRVYLLVITPEESWARERDITDHPLDLDWLRQKYARYEEMAAIEPERFTIIDASQDINKVYKNLLDAVMSDMVEIERIVT